MRDPDDTAALRVGGLFSGIGGWELGLERAGMEIAWHCEADPFCRKVLAKHWSVIPCYEDVRTLKGADVEPVDVLCGGFPCQDLSIAGKKAGLDGERSGLWAEMLRLACELRPRYLLIENVSALLSGERGAWMRRLLCDLASCGFDAEWDCLPASAFGAPHRRDRIWIVAYPDSEQLREQPRRRSGTGREGSVFVGADGPQRATTPVADAPGARLERRSEPATTWPTLGELTDRSGPKIGGTWALEPDLPRVADGIPDWVDRTKSTGNALVPQIAEWIGRRIVAYEEAS